MNSPKTISIILHSFLSLVTLSTLYLLSTHYITKFADFGAGDFTQYWTAFQIVTAGGNPYNGDLMLRYQQNLSPTLNNTIMMWNPPWLLLLLYPILSFSFIEAARLWFVIGLGIYLFSSFSFIKKLTGNNTIGLQFGLIIIFFNPLWCSLSSGQIGIILWAAGCFFYCFLVAKKDLYAGIVFSILSIKPHLFYLIGLLAFFEVIRSKRYKLDLGFFIGIIFQISLCEIIWPSAIKNWITSILSDQGGPYIRIVDWQVNNLVGLCRTIMTHFSNGQDTWPELMILIPGLFFISSFLFLLKTKRNIISLFPYFLCLSLFSAPYGWPYDQTCLMLTQLITINKASNTHRTLIISAFLFINVLMYPLAKLIGEVYVFSLFPVLVLAIAFLESTLKPSLTISSIVTDK